MSEQHIDNLIIKNFKCFQELKLENIGQVNLISGKNNVGKTAFLEAVEIFVSSNKPYDLAKSTYNILNRRQNINDQENVEMDFIYNKYEIEISSTSPVKNCILKLNTAKNEKSSSLNEEVATSFFSIAEVLFISVNDATLEIPIDKFNLKKVPITKIKEHVIYIPSSIVSEQDIAISYGVLIELNRENLLNESLSLFDGNISELKPIPKEHGVVLKLKLQNKDSLVLLSSLGEGVNRYIAILCAIWANKDGVLLIDEIENGIHYTNYKKLWEIIFQASIDANCQLFITSHSKECITAFNDVQFEIVSCNAQYFEFYKNLKTDLITLSARDKEQLRYALTHEGRIRGE